VIATDVDAVYADWGTPDQRPIRRATPAELAAGEYAEGSMGPKVAAACMFVEKSGGTAAIGSIAEIGAVLHGDAGTTVAAAAVPTT
jgi:carbamate kinase